MPPVHSPGRRAALELSTAPAGGGDATSALYERDARRIYSFCRFRLGSREEAEDAVQSVPRGHRTPTLCSA
jgi:DNA-directed RNA polymerase specialized sigma24 family protein